MAGDDSKKLMKERVDALGLSEKHVKILRMEPVSAETVFKMGRDNEQPLDKRPAIKIPYFDPTGKLTSFARYRYLGEPKGFAAAAEKPPRYFQIKDTLNEVYMPPVYKTSWAEILADASVPLIVTEGEFKSAVGTAKGRPTLGLGGVEMFRASKRGFTELLPTLEEANWKQREVAIIWDSDVGAKPAALGAQRRLAYELARRGALLRLLALPADGTKKVGLDDFLLSNSIEELDEIIATTEPFEEAIALWKLNEEVVLVQHPPLVIIRRNHKLVKPTDFVKVTFADRKFTTLDAEGKPRVKSLPQAWLEWPQRFVVDSMTFRPGEARITDKGEWNTWSGWGVESKKGNVDPWHELLDFVFKSAEPEAREWFERWCAYPIQNPGAKLFSAVVIWGVTHGTGKTLLGLTLKDIYGRHGIKIGEKQLHGQFNEWARDKQFVLGEEITGKTDRRELANELKDLITGEELNINAKFLPTVILPDTVNYYFTSNAPNAFFLEDSDRRYFVHELVGGQGPIEMYRRYDKWRGKGKGPGVPALRYYLEHLALGDFDPNGHAFATQAKREMILDNKSEIARWVYELKQAPARMLLGLAKSEAIEKCDIFTTHQLYNIFNPANDFRRGTLNGLSRELKSAGFQKPFGGIVVKTKVGPQRFWIVRNDEKWVKASRGLVAEHWEQFWAAGRKFE